MTRYLLLAFVSLVLVLSGSSPAVAPAGATVVADPVQGDVNCDETVNSVDSLQVLRSVAGLGTSALCLTAAGDVNCDGAVNSVDSLRMLRYVAGLSNAPVDGCVAIGEALGPEELPPTSEELIAAALDAGEITYEESLLYRAYALYDLPGLPEEFRSPVIDYHAANALLLQIQENESQLSQGLLEDLAAFRARPADPISIFNNQAASLTGSVTAAAGTWKSKVAVAGKLRVWVKDNQFAETQLTGFAYEAQRAWDAIGQAPTLFRYGLPDTPGAPEINPDDSIDIYFAPVNEIDRRKDGCSAVPPPAECQFQGAGGGYTGYTGPVVNGRTQASYVVIDAAVSGPMLVSHIAHELMHTGQHAYDIWEPFWLKDATATWGAVRVLQRLNITRQPNFDYLPAFFPELDQTLTRDVDLSRYASWIYFLFASMEKGDGIVTKIWENAAAAGVQNAQAVDNEFPFQANFDDFALRNWNQKPPLVKWYRDGTGDSTFPTSLVPEPKTRSFVFDDEQKETDAISPLAAVYYRYTFGDLVRKVKFNKIIAGNPNVRVWALIKIGNEWKPPEDWSSKVTQTFCRDLPDQNLTELVIIMSNSHMTNTVPAGDKLKMETRTEGCAGWVGTTTGVSYFRCCSDSANSSEGSQILETRTTFTGLWEEDPTFFYGCNCTALFPTGTIEWSVDYRVESECCTCSDTDSGQLAAGTGLHLITQQMMIRWDDPSDPSKSIYSGGGFVPIDAFINCDDGFTYPVMDFFYLSPEINLPTPSPTPTPTPAPSPTPNPTTMPPAPIIGANTAGSGAASCDGTQFKVADDATTFSGSCYLGVPYPNDYARFEWSFTRVELVGP